MRPTATCPRGHTYDRQRLDGTKWCTACTAERSAARTAARSTSGRRRNDADMPVLEFDVALTHADIMEARRNVHAVQHVERRALGFEAA